MDHSLKIYNTLSRKKESFKPTKPPFVGLYVCGPTVYSDPHLGHARAAITFDVVLRYLKHLGYKVRYVSNITDVGHLEDEVTEQGEDKIAKRARLEQLEPMEIVHYYMNRYHDALQKLNVIPPNIEPQASGHIIEQIEMVKCILEKGYAYEVDGSVYFDVPKYHKTHHYGKLSGKVLEDLIEESRTLEGQAGKRHKVDFALWKKAAPQHIMQWPSPWGNGFPGWHLECSVMSGKYLGVPFDIHGGGMDLQFPHHECEIAQAVACHNKEPVRYWMHNNLITIKGQKMSKSLGNFITIQQLFDGDHPELEAAFSPMTLRFFMLQTHYRSTLDFSNKALQAARKGYQRLMHAMENLQALDRPSASNANPEDTLDKKVSAACADCHKFMQDDFNTARVLAALFDLTSHINAFYNQKQPLTAISKETYRKLKDTFTTLITDVLGLEPEETQAGVTTEGLVELLLELRQEARARKDFDTSDKIRDQLKALNVAVKDTKDGTTWHIETTS